jgi:hypothetical protein
MKERLIAAAPNEKVGYEESERKAKWILNPRFHAPSEEFLLLLHG